jgi:hypothetical protein
MLDSKDAFNTISVILNYCQRNYFQTDDELFLREKFDILKFAVRNELNTFDSSEGLDGGRFYNIVSTALDFNEIEWTEDFINKYGIEIEPEKKDYLVAFANSMVLSSRKKNDEALERLSRLRNPASSTDKFNLKVLQMKIYFEKNFIDQAESTADSFRHMIQNDNVLPEIYKESHKNFCNFYVKLLALKNKQDVSSLNDLKDKLTAAKNVVQKKWIVKKVNELTK